LTTDADGLRHRATGPCLITKGALKPTADGEITDDTREAIARLLVESDDLENSTAFWGGFRAGVAGFLVEHGIDVDSERPNN
jgi:hypothetical protein